MWCWFYNIMYILMSVGLIVFGLENISNGVCTSCGVFYIIIGAVSTIFFGSRCHRKTECGKFPEEE